MDLVDVDIVFLRCLPISHCSVAVMWISFFTSAWERKNFVHSEALRKNLFEWGRKKEKDEIYQNKLLDGIEMRIEEMNFVGKMGISARNEVTMT